MWKLRVMQEAQVFLPMTAKADLKALTEHIMFLMLQIASRRKRQQGRERDREKGGRFLLFYFCLPTMAEQIFDAVLPPSRSRYRKWMF